MIRWQTIQRGKLVRAASHYLAMVGILLTWQFTSSAGLLNPSLLPAPLEILRALWYWLLAGGLLFDVASSLLRVSAGFLLACVLGIAVGVSLGISPFLSRQVTVVIELLRPIPPIAWIPLAILWFGIGNGAAVFIVCLGASFPIFTNTYLGVTSIRMIHINTARCLGAGRRLLITDVLLPAALPSILVGLRTGIGVAWMSLIAAELVGAQSGLGYMIQLNRILLNTENVIGGMLTIGLVGLLMNRAIIAVEQEITPWNRDTLRTQQRGWEK